MNINTIDSTNFNGYVDKSVVKYFKSRQKMLYKEALETVKNSSDSKTVTVKNYQEVTKRMNETMNLLKEFMAELHPATCIKFQESNALNAGQHFYFKNDKTKTKSYKILRLNNDIIGRSNEWDIMNNINIIHNWVKEKLKYKNSETKCIDSEIFNSMIRGMEFQAEDTSIIGRLVTYFNIKKANQLAEEFGEKPVFEKFVNKEQDIITAQAKKDEAIKTFVNDAKKFKLNF